MLPLRKVTRQPRTIVDRVDSVRIEERFADPQKDHGRTSLRNILHSCSIRKLAHRRGPRPATQSVLTSNSCGSTVNRVGTRWVDATWPGLRALSKPDRRQQRPLRLKRPGPPPGHGGECVNGSTPRPGGLQSRVCGLPFEPQTSLRDWRRRPTAHQLHHSDNALPYNPNKGSDPNGSDIYKPGTAREITRRETDGKSGKVWRRCEARIDRRTKSEQLP